MFDVGQVVRGVRFGKFLVVKVEVSRKGHCEMPIVTVREFGPNDQLSSDTMRLPAFVLRPVAV